MRLISDLKGLLFLLIFDLMIFHVLISYVFPILISYVFSYFNFICFFPILVSYVFFLF
jgi:hypothetical protein